MNDVSAKLLAQLIENKSVVIRGVKKQVQGLARYATTNSPDAEYIKISYSDKSGMYFALDDPTVFYFEQKLPALEEFANGECGRMPELVWKGKKFTVVNPNDYQFVRQFYIGTVGELEGEVRFSDYADETGNVLSLGWNMFENARDDVYAEILPPEDLKF